MTDDIDRMTDEELVRACAVEVMGWKGSQFGKWKDGEIVFPHGVRKWNPLDDWNHAMQVVGAIRAKRFGFLMVDQEDDDGHTGSVGVAFSPTRNWPNSFVKHGEEKRAVLRAALKAVRSKP